MTDKILIDRAVLEQAIAAIYGLLTFNTTPDEYAEGRKAKESLRAVLEQPQVEQEPYIWYCPDYGWVWTVEAVVYRGDTDGMIPLYTHPQPPRQPLTDEQIDAIVANYGLNVGDWSKNGASVARAIERAHVIG